MKIKEHDITTGEIVERDMSSDELDQSKADNLAAQLDNEALSTKDAAKQSVLDKLGLTSDEVTALLG